MQSTSSCNFFLLKCISFAIATYCLPMPAYGQTVINIPPDVFPSTVNSNTTINLSDGGSIPDDFSIGLNDGSVANVELNITGGVVGRRLRTADGSTVNMSGGIIGPGIFANGGDLNIIDGTIDGRFDVSEGARVNFSGGQIRSNSFGGLRVLGGEVNFTGGEIAGQLELDGTAGGVFNYKGGRIGQDARMLGGSFNVFGAEFLLDGEPLEDFTDSIQFDIPDGMTLSGTLSDGTTFALNRLLTPHSDEIANGVLTLQKVAIPNIGLSVIDIPSSPSPNGLRAGQVLNVLPGGTIGDIFTANPGSTINIHGGQVGDLLEAVNATVNITDGTVGGAFAAISNSVVSVSGGSVGSLNLASESVAAITGGSFGRVEVRSGSELVTANGDIFDLFIFDKAETTILSGTVESTTVQNGGILKVNGGEFESSVLVDDGATIVISGGSFNNRFTAISGSEVNINALELLLDSLPIIGLVPGEPLAITDTNKILSGLLADGTPFEFALTRLCDRGCQFEGIDPGATLTVMQVVVPEPSTLFLILGAVLSFGGRQRGQAPRRGSLG